MEGPSGKDADDQLAGSIDEVLEASGYRGFGPAQWLLMLVAGLVYFSTCAGPLALGNWGSAVGHSRGSRARTTAAVHLPSGVS
jgi:hypothetical protein